MDATEGASEPAAEPQEVVKHPKWVGRMFGQWDMKGPKGLWKPHWPMPQPEDRKPPRPLEEKPANVPPPRDYPKLYYEVKPSSKQIRSALEARGLATDGDRAAIERRLAEAIAAEGGAGSQNGGASGMAEAAERVEEAAGAQVRPLSPGAHTGYTPEPKKLSRSTATADADGVQDLASKFEAQASPQRAGDGAHCPDL